MADKPAVCISIMFINRKFSRCLSIYLTFTLRIRVSNDQATTDYWPLTLSNISENVLLLFLIAKIA